MYPRDYWQNLIETSWKRKNLIWLAGVRRTGKTVLCRSLESVDYYDCELPRVRQLLSDPESFLEDRTNRRIILDEIHRLQNPTEILKIAADHFPTVKIVATGSSTLGVSGKFKDTLTGRKIRIKLTPMCCRDSENFENANLEHRFLHGGLPDHFLSKAFPEYDYKDWIDSYWAKDVQELFRLEKRFGFIRFTELMLANSGGMFEATSYARPCEISRPTVNNYLAVLEATFLATIIRPFSTHKPTEIVSTPKVYGFDTGFVCAYRGWHTLRQEDMGILWEHLVLNEYLASQPQTPLNYWRDKRGHEVDFILAASGTPPTAIECKWRAGNFSPRSLKIFRRKYPKGKNIVVASDVREPYRERVKGMDIQYVNINNLIDYLKP